MQLFQFSLSIFISTLLFIETLEALNDKSIIGVMGGVIALIGTIGMAYCFKKEIKEE